MKFSSGLFLLATLAASVLADVDVTYSPEVSEVASSTTVTFVIPEAGDLATPVITFDLPETFSIDYMAVCVLNNDEQVYAVAEGVDSTIWTATYTKPVSGALTISCENFHLGQAESEEPKGKIIVKDGTTEKRTHKVTFPAVTPFTISHVSALTDPPYQMSEGTIRFEIPNLLFTVYINDTIRITLPTAAAVTPGYYIHPVYSHCSTGSGSRYTAVETEPGPVISLVATSLMPPMSESFYIDCENITTSAAHSGFQSGSMDFFAGESATIKRGHAANITYSAVTVPTLGGTIARVFTSTHVPGSKGWLSVALRPLPVDALKGDKLVLTLPNAWAVGESAPKDKDLECRFAINIKQPDFANLPATGSFTKWPAAGSQESAELTITLGADAAKTAERTVFFHCGQLALPADGTPASVAKASLVSDEGGVLAESGDITLPAVNDGEPDEVIVEMTFSLLSKDVLSRGQMSAVISVISSLANVDKSLVHVAHQTLSAAPKSNSNKDDVPRPLSVTVKSRIARSELFEDIRARLRGSKVASRIKAALDGTDVTITSEATAIDEVARCWNQKKDFDETDSDCGGETCSGCPLYGKCSGNSDCGTGDCRGGKCTQPNSAARVSSAVAVVLAAIAAIALVAL